MQKAHHPQSFLNWRVNIEVGRITQNYVEDTMLNGSMAIDRQMTSLQWSMPTTTMAISFTKELEIQFYLLSNGERFTKDL